MVLHPDFQKILDQFKSRCGDKKGTAFFYGWLRKRNLDDTKPYSPNQLKRECKGGKCSHRCVECLKESFQWAKPLIRLFKQDSQAKYYQVEAHFAVTSMNKRVYNLEEILQAVHTLPGSGVNLNHVADWLLPGVEIMAANFEDGAAECIIRVPNGTSDAKGRDVQEAMDSGEIDCVSVEVESNVAVENPEGELELYGMKYTGLALLDQDALPGIPLTKIMPLEMLVESIFSEMERLEHPDNREVNEKLSEEIKQFGEASEANAKFCPICGKELAEGACTNNECARRGKKVDMTIESLAKANKQLADATEETVQLTKANGELEDSAKSLREQIADLSQKLSAATIENLKIPMLRERVEELEQKAVTLQTEKTVLRGKNEAYAEANANHEKNVNRLEAKAQKLEEDLAKERAETESLTHQLNEESVKRATAEQKALNETSDASKIKQANAKLLDEKALDTRKISELSDTLSESAKRVLAAEEGLANAKTEVKKRDEIIIEKQKAIERADRENKRVHKTLEEISRKHGIYEVDEKGNLVLPS